jgi:sugar transferase (PEP-CTERM/EpsH1 system associated)
VARPHSVIPNGVDSEYFHPNGDRSTNVPVIVFVGRMDYFPNIDGALYFVREILPLIRKAVPQAELRIVGSDPAAAILKLRELPGVTVTGHVPDVRPYLMHAAVSVAPLRIARGTQNKILESMAMGTPVVATPQAAKGVQAYPGQHLLVAEQPQAFADKVINLLEQSKSRSILSNAGRRQVEEVHAWASSMSVLDRILAYETGA